MNIVEMILSHLGVFVYAKIKEEASRYENSTKNIAH